MENNMIFWTHAYNAERTVGRTIESVLSQNNGNFKYYILDNGSTDSTGDIIRKYAKKDKRINPLFCQTNHGSVTEEYLPLFLSHGREGYFAWIDADDEYKPEFLEKMLVFVTENNLDVAACGTDYIEQDSQIRPDLPPKTLVLEGRDFADCFPYYYKYTTRLWGVLYSLETLISMLMPYNSVVSPVINSFSDSTQGLRAFRSANRAGILSICLHKYYMSPNQLSRVYTPDWFWWVKSIQKNMEKFLLRYGPISRENQCYLWVRFLVWLKLIIPRIQAADVSLEVKVSDLYEIFSDKKTGTLLSLDWKSVGIYSEKKELITDVKEWAVGNDDSPENHQITKPLIRLLDSHLEAV